MSLGEKDASEILGSLQGKGDHYTKLSVVERKRHADLEDAIAHISSETERYRAMAKSAGIEVMNKNVVTPKPCFQRADGVDVGRQAQQVTTKVLIILEKNLNKLLQRQSEILISNRALKEEINHFRRLRLQTDVSHAKFEMLLAEVKRGIETRLAESAAIVEERERLVAEKENLELIKQEEQKIFAEHYEEMGAFIKLQNEALEMSLLKERKEDQKQKSNAAKAKLDAASTSASLAEGSGSVAGNNTNSAKAAAAAAAAAQQQQQQQQLNEEVEMARQMTGLTHFAQSEQSFLQGIQQKINGYEAMFEQLKRMTGAESLEEVVSAYVAHEEEMFSLYNFIQAVNMEIDAVVETSKQIKQDIELEKENQEQKEATRKSALLALQTRLEETQEQTKTMFDERENTTEGLKNISKKIGLVFSKLQCEQIDAKAAQAQADKKGGGGGGEAPKGRKGVTMSRPEGKVALLMVQGANPTESNVMDFMGCVEQRAVDIISEYLRSKPLDHSAPAGSASPTPGPASPMHYPSDTNVSFEALDDDDFLLEAGDNEVMVDLTSFRNRLANKLGLSRK